MFRIVARLLFGRILSNATWRYGESPQSQPDSSPPQIVPESAETHPAEPVPMRSSVYRVENLHAAQLYEANPEHEESLKIDEMELLASFLQHVGDVTALT